jgi:hypothetical protein
MLTAFLHNDQPLTLGKTNGVLSEAMAHASPGGNLGNALDALRTVSFRCICNDT